MKKVILAHILLLFVTIFWGLNPIIGKVLNSTFHPVAVSTLRWLVACAILIPIACLKETVDFIKIKKSLKTFILAALCGVTIFQTFTYLAVQYTSPTNTMLITTATPVLVSLFVYFYYRES